VTFTPWQKNRIRTVVLEGNRNLSENWPTLPLQGDPPLGGVRPAQHAPVYPRRMRFTIAPCSKKTGDKPGDDPDSFLASAGETVPTRTMKLVIDRAPPNGRSFLLRADTPRRPTVSPAAGLARGRPPSPSCAGTTVWSPSKLKAAWEFGKPADFQEIPPATTSPRRRGERGGN